MARATLAKISAAFLLLFVISLGAGYALGATVRTGGGDAGRVASATTSSTLVDAAPTTSSEPPGASTSTTAETPSGPRRPTRDDPLRVVMAGDSVMAGLTPPVKAALEADGTTTVRFVLTPSILRDPAVRFTWTTQLEQFDPEVVVMFVGTWESGVVQTAGGVPPTDPRWRDQYEKNILDPWIQLITSKGASVLWIGNPTVRNPDANVLFAKLNAAFKDMPGRWPQVTYLPSDPMLNGSGTSYHDIIGQPDGTSVRTRQTDGLHLCAGGAELLGKQVIAYLEGRGAKEANGWEDGAWRTDVVYPVERCPAA